MDQLYRLTLALGATLDEEHEAAAFMVWLAEAVEPELAALFLADEPRQTLRLAAAHGFALAGEPWLPLGLDPWGWLAGQGVILPATEEERRYAVPLMAENKLLGTLCLVSRRQADELIAEQHLMQAAAGCLAPVLRNAWRHRTLEQQVAERTATLEAINAISTAVSQSLDLEATLATALDATLQAIGFEAGGITLWNEAEQRLERLITQGVEPEVAAAFIGPPRPGGHREWLLRTGQPVFHDDTTHDPTVNPEVARHGFALSAMVPLAHGGKVLGVMAVATRTAGRWTEGEKRLLIAAGRQIAVAVANAQLYEQIRESERKLQEAQRLGRIGHWEFDLRTQQIQWSGMVYTIYERDPQLGPPTAEEEAAYYSPEDAARLRRSAMRTIETGEPYEAEVTVNLPGGRHACVVATGTPVRDAQGRVVRLLGTVQDITGRKRAEDALRLKMEQLHALARAGQAVTATLELEQVLAQIIELAGRVVGPAQASVVLVDEAGRMHESAEGLPGMPAIQYRVRTAGFADWIIRSREPVIVDDIAANGTVNPATAATAPQTANPALVAAGIRSFAGLPLIAKDRLLGVLFLHSTEPNAFHGQLELLTAFAGQAAIAIENARLYDAIQKELAARKEAEEAYTTLVEHSLQGFVIIQDGRVVFANPAIAELSGYSREEMLALSPEQVKAAVHPEDRERIWGGLTARLRGEPIPPRREFRFVRKDGTVRWVEILANRIEYRGRPAVQAAYLDVTERKQAEEALRESEERFRTLAETTSTAIFVYSGERFVYVNRATQQLTGYSADELLAMRFWDVVHPDFRDLIRRRGLARQRGEDVPTRYEFKIVCKDGTERWIDFTGGRIEWQGQPAAIGSAFDITGRKQAEEALRAREAELAAVFESTPIFLALLDDERRVTKINRAGADFADRPADQVLGLRQGEALRCFHAFDDPRGCGFGPHCEQCVVRRTVLDTLQTGRSHFQVEADYPVRRDGRIETLRLLVSTAPVSTPAGPRVLICMEDITARHRALEALRTVYDLGQKLVLSRRVEEIARLVTDAAQAVLRFPRCELWLADEQARAVVPIGQAPAEPPVESPSLPLDDERGIIAATVRGGQAIYLPDVDQDPRYIRGSNYSSRSELCVPLKVHERTIGALNTESDQLDAFSPADRELLEALANTAAVAIENARLYEETRQARELNEGIVRSASDAIVLQDADGYVVVANPAAEAMMGYPPGGLRGRHWTEFIPADQHPIVLETNARRQQGQADRYEIELVRPDGSRFTALVGGSPRFEGERLAGTLAVFSDITERKRRERELEAQALLAQALSETLELQPLLERLLRAARHAIPAAEKGSLALLTDEEHLQVQALSGYRDPDVLGFTYPITWGYAGRALRERRPLLIPDVQADPALQTDAQIAESGEVGALRSALVVPLQAAGAPIGALSLESSRPHAFTGADLQTLIGMASTAGLLIQNARLYEETRHRARHQEALNAIITAATTVTDLPSLLEIALEHVLAGLGLEMGAIWVREHPDGPIAGRVLRGLPDPTGMAMEGEITGVGHAAGLPHGVSLAVNDWGQLTGPFAALTPIMARHNVAASITAPIGEPGQALGELSVAAPRPRAWSAAEVALVEAVGRQLAGAIERLQLLQRIQRQAAQMQEVLDNVPAGVLLLDEQHRILVANPLAREYLTVLDGVKVGEALEHLGDRPITEFLRPSQVGPAHELVIKGPPERVFTVLAEAVPTEGAAVGWIVVLRDVTQEHVARERVETRDRLAAVGQLAAGIAHDFNNILSVIILHSYMAQHAPEVSGKTRERLTTITEQAQQASKLVEQILDFSRRAVLEPRPLDLLPFLKEEVKLLQRTLPEDIKITLDAGHEAYVVNADPTRLQQVFMNLAVNARDAMPEGGRLHFTLERLRIAGREPTLPDLEPGEWVRVRVADTGVGIAAEVLPRIFEPFFTTKAPGKGTGLGLSQVYGIVKQHGGEIDVHSQPGKGAEFTIYLPAHAEAAGQKGPAAQPEPEQGAGQTILVVEDNETTRIALADSLEMLGYRVLTAAGGREALALLAQHRGEISLVLSDLVMPDLGGKGLLQELRAQGETLPVIIVTGHALDERIPELREYGLTGWLLKPPDIEELAKMIKEALLPGRQRAHAASGS